LNSSHFAQIEDHPLVSFLPLNLASTDSLETVISHIDYAMQYGEDEEPKEVSLFPIYFLLCSHSLQPHDLDEGDFPDVDEE